MFESRGDNTELAAMVRSTGPTGVQERGEDTVRTPQEPGSSCVRPALEQPAVPGFERDQALREVSARTGANQETKRWSGEANQ